MKLKKCEIPIEYHGKEEKEKKKKRRKRRKREKGEKESSRRKELTFHLSTKGKLWHTPAFSLERK